MVAHMKTTVEIPDAVLDEARQVAATEGTTVRSLIETGLRREIQERRRRVRFRMRRASFKGRGLRPDVAGGSWEQIRGLAYEGRGE